MKKSNKTLATLAFFPLLAFTIYANAQTLQKIDLNNRIAVSYRESSIPFSYVPGPNARPTGFAIDLTESIVESVKKKLNKTNLEVEYVPVTGQNRIPLLVDGSYDLECGSTTNNAMRGKEVSFAVSHFYSGTRLLVKKVSNIKNYSDLNAKIVAIVAGSANEKVLRQHIADKKINIQVISGKDYSDAFKLVESDQAVALALDDILLFGLIANSAKPADYEVVAETLQIEPYGCMMRKDDPEFKKLVDAAIVELMINGEFEKLYSKWFESPIPPHDVLLNMPMSQQLKNNLKNHDDKPVQ